MTCSCRCEQSMISLNGEIIEWWRSKSLRKAEDTRKCNTTWRSWPFIAKSVRIFPEMLKTCSVTLSAPSAHSQFFIHLVRPTLLRSLQKPSLFYHKIFSSSPFALFTSHPWLRTEPWFLSSVSLLTKPAQQMALNSINSKASSQSGFLQSVWASWWRNAFLKQKGKEWRQWRKWDCFMQRGVSLS